MAPLLSSALRARTQDKQNRAHARFHWSYVHFLRTHGAFKVMYGGQELIGMEAPEHLRTAAPDPSDASGGDEPEVDEKHFRDFSTHIVGAIDDFIETYAEA